ncbi:hypothetical protein [methanotrophic endosymbiont of Bathymodiolus puteoserpentis (Logatchev)]|nr:hypothetical protein [methanotrophic endosymbiont of Bathymodiolus puteoserpentis (Logatchev)]SHE22603.1 hypothetical protein BPUTEOMOX_2315 [methanotrophic endosymbiont of Bathymodiolus puteoserpentis (Logatchev)]
MNSPKEMNSAIANSFLLNSPNNALDCYFLILFSKPMDFHCDHP